MVEYIVEVSAHFESRSIAELEKLAHPEIHSPSPRSRQSISFRDIRIVERVSSNGWWRKGIRVEELIALPDVLVAAEHEWPERSATKSSHGVNKLARHISGKNRVAIVAEPEWSKPCTTLGKHIPGKRETTKRRLSPAGKVVSVTSTFAKRKFVNAVRNESVTRHKRVGRKVVRGSELVVERATETCVAGIKSVALLVQQCVARVKC